MAPENARIYYVEDDPNSKEIAREFLESAGHTVILEADSLWNALDNIQKLGELKINVSIIDANLSEDDHNSGNDGEMVAMAIKSSWPNILVIGNSLENDIPSADMNCLKTRGYSNLAETVTNA